MLLSLHKTSEQHIPDRFYDYGHLFAMSLSMYSADRQLIGCCTGQPIFKVCRAVSLLVV
jgi:hypothetical protein